MNVQSQAKQESSMSSPASPLSPAQLLELIQRLPVGISVHDGAGATTWANPTLGRFLGTSPQALLGRGLDALPLTLAGKPADDPRLYRVSGAPGASAEWLRCSRWLLQAEGPETGFVCVYVDGTELERARIQVDRLRQALHGQVSTDELTGLLNQRAALNQLEAQVSRSRRYHNPLSVMLVRLQGHGGAERPSDQTVQEVSRLLRDQTRWPDIIARWEHADFLLILPETGADAAAKLAAKLQDHLGRSQSAHGRKGSGFSARFGIAEWTSGIDTMELLRRVAQAADGA
jgi:diguanylate cyclase (GGDEF)-like protein